MNATDRLDMLLSGMLKNPSTDFCNGTSRETSIPTSSRLTFSEPNSHPSIVMPSANKPSVPLPPRRDASSMKHHRRRPRIDPSNQQKQDQPLLNSSTLDDLFRALALECEQCLAATSSYQNKTYDQILVQHSSNGQTAVESNDDDYENLHPTRSSQSIKTSISPLKTSIQVISPIKRHVVSITVSSKISSPQTPPSLPTPTNRHSSEEDTMNISSTSTNRKRHRRRTRKQVISSSATTRSSSSSNERKEIPTEKKPSMTKRSYSTDPRCQRHKTSSDGNVLSFPTSQKQCPKRPQRRDVSLQHSLSTSRRFREDHSSPLSVLLTSTKPTSDFLDHSNQRTQRRSRLESLDHKPSTLLNHLHQQFHRASSNRNTNSNKTNIPTHRIPSHPVY